VKRSLTKIVTWGHEFLAEVVKPGGLAVDLTAGNGNDTHFLYQLVGRTGQVVAFDIQSEALVHTGTLLESYGIEVRNEPGDGVPLRRQAGVDLIEVSHEQLGCYVSAPTQGVVANLGYLPGGDRTIITSPESTIAALNQAVLLLSAGGRLVVVVYPGHPGGSEEAAAVTDFFSNLSEDVFQVLQLRVSNRSQAPFLFVAEKIARGCGD